MIINMYFYNQHVCLMFTFIMFLNMKFVKIHDSFVAYQTYIKAL